MKRGFRTTLITGLVALTIAGTAAFNAANKYFNAPISYDSDGKTPIYTQMISETNIKEGHRKAKFGAYVNGGGGMNSQEEMDSYPSSSDYNSIIKTDLAKRIVEIPSKEVIKRGLRNVTKEAGSNGSTIQCFNGSGMSYDLNVHAFDRDEIKKFELYEINPDTKEKIRLVKKLEGEIKGYHTTLGKYMANVSIDFEEQGIVDAKLLRLEVTDKKDNKYHSFIELNVKKTFFDYIVEDIK